MQHSATLLLDTSSIQNYSPVLLVQYIPRWNFETIYGVRELSRNRVVEPAQQATLAAGINPLESIP
jgi:hypothetical protein